MRISEVAARSGVPATTLRYYDSIGLIDARREPNGYRAYDDGVLERLTFIEAAKKLELSLPEIAELLVVVDGDSCTQVRDALHPKLTDRLREVDAHLAALRLLRERLVVASERVAACPDSGESCRSECMLLGAIRRACQSDQEPAEGSQWS
ncbi:MerR family transcriptional regulator [Leucobacter weissii]|uniref:MerR family transcriptional regulator n=1 Tax=Leucobacter weissii TaxID=1983706 RepID=A0A939MM99_9MICO|nr:MerR family transcriptional regulator [Leucobacter weissii]